jgi:hypothetical protein
LAGFFVFVVLALVGFAGCGLALTSACPITALNLLSALDRHERLMGSWWEFDSDRVTWGDDASRNNDTHYTCFADEFATGPSF